MNNQRKIPQALFPPKPFNISELEQVREKYKSAMAVGEQLVVKCSRLEQDNARLLAENEDLKEELAKYQMNGDDNITPLPFD
jgi:hypothetical protein